MIGAIRRRMMGGESVDLSKYAITAKTNPEMMAVLYEEGVAANPKYMTKEEASVAYAGGVLSSALCSVPHLDLRWFTSWQGGMSKANNLHCSKLTMPNVSGKNPILVNTWWSLPTGLTIVIPDAVTKFDPCFANTTSTSGIRVVLEPIIPPTVSRLAFFQSNDTLPTVDTIYVPNLCVNAYKEWQSSASKIGKFYAQYTIKPISEYVE